MKNILAIAVHKVNEQPEITDITSRSSDIYGQLPDIIHMMVMAIGMGHLTRLKRPGNTQKTNTARALIFLKHRGSGG